MTQKQTTEKIQTERKTIHGKENKMTSKYFKRCSLEITDVQIQVIMQQHLFQSTARSLSDLFPLFPSAASGIQVSLASETHGVRQVGGMKDRRVGSPAFLPSLCLQDLWQPPGSSGSCGSSSHTPSSTLVLVSDRQPQLPASSDTTFCIFPFSLGLTEVSQYSGCHIIILFSFSALPATVQSIACIKCPLLKALQCSTGL